MSLAGMVLIAGAATGQEAIKTLLITGQNNHNWWYTSRVHEDTLEATGRFEVDVTETPETVLADAARLATYKLIVLDYNDAGKSPRWGEAAEANFLKAVASGTGVVAIHASNNAFKGWTEYEKMLGLMWREGTGHGKVHEFTVEIVDAQHPVTAGLAPFATTDELYHKLANPQKSPYSLLAQAMSSTDSGGTGAQEPMALTLAYGKGRVFATPLGHVWPGADDTKTSVLTTGFRTLLSRGAEWAATGSVTLPAEWRDTRKANQLTSEEQTQGWTLLFDGKDPTGLRGYKKDGMPTDGSWTIVDGTIRHTKGMGGGDICTKDEYGDFEFKVDWLVTPGANSGIIYRSTEDHTYSWETGMEMQILDDARHPDGKNAKTRAGTLYALEACAQQTARPPGEWNHAHVIVRGTRIQHWLNGVKVVDVDTSSEAYKKAFAESKFTKMPAFGTRSRGHICLQDHGDEVWFRNVKVRSLDKK
jgi:type 1 glutamine amidotransferase